MTVMIRNWFVFVSVSKAQLPLVFFSMYNIYIFFSVKVITVRTTGVRFGLEYFCHLVQSLPFFALQCIMGARFPHTVRQKNRVANKYCLAPCVLLCVLSRVHLLRGALNFADQWLVSLYWILPDSEMGPETDHFNGVVSQWSSVCADTATMVNEVRQPRKYLFAVTFSAVCIPTVPGATDRFII